MGTTIVPMGWETAGKSNDGKKQETFCCCPSRIDHCETYGADNETIATPVAGA